MCKISIITPTKNRQEQLNLVIDCINNQTKKPDEWIIVDDGDCAIDKSILDKISIPYIYTHYKSRLKTSTSLNSAKCLEFSVGDKIIFIDDDDYYPPTYIENFEKLLVNDNEMIGNSRWIDYRLSTGFYRIRLKSEEQLKSGDVMCEWHGSGIMGKELKKRMIDVLKANPSERYNDCLCYEKIFKNKEYNCVPVDFGEWSAISLKDYRVGNPGTIEAHRTNNGLIKDDESYSFFKKCLKDDWVKYEKYLGSLR